MDMFNSMPVHGPSPCFGGKEDAERAALWPKRPRRNHENGKEEIDEDVKRVSAVVSHCGVRCGRSRHIEEDAGIGPFLESRKARYGYGYGSQHLPDSKDGQEVRRVAEDLHDALDVTLQVRQFR